MILSDQDIIDAVERTGELVIKGPAGNDQIKNGHAQDGFVLESMGFGLRIQEILSYRDGGKISWPNDKKYWLQPGELVIVETYERIALSKKLAGTIHGRARKSLMGEIGISTTIHPGWPGNAAKPMEPAPLRVAVSNHGPSPLYLEQRGEPFCRVLLHQMLNEPNLEAPRQDEIFSDADKAFEVVQSRNKQRSLLQKRWVQIVAGLVLLTGVIVSTILIQEPLRTPLSTGIGTFAGALFAYILTR